MTNNNNNNNNKPVCISLDDFHDYAKATMPKSAYDYYAQGAMDNETRRNNRKAFSKIRIRPRVMRDVSNIDTSCEILGHKISMPIGIAPMAMHKLAHPDGELATARAAAANDTLMILSTYSTYSMEDVAKAAPNGLRFLQLYVHKDRKVAKDLIKRAEAAGYESLVVTVDRPQLGRRIADAKNKFKRPTEMKMENLKAEKPQKNENRSTFNKGMTGTVDSGLNWEKDIAWLRETTKLPIILKGILTAEDALLAVKYKVDAIIVSNHGGRQLDGAPPSIEALPEIADAVKGRIPIYLDSGIYRGSDVFKAIAYGANAVFVGRPTLWALCYDGEKGVDKMLNIIREEFRLTMALAGCTSIDQITRDYVRRKELYIPKL